MKRILDQIIHRPMEPDQPDQAQAPIRLDSALLRDVPVILNVKLGEIEISIEDLLKLRPGATLALDARLSDLVELKLNETTIATAEIVSVDHHFAVRIVEISAQ